MHIIERGTGDPLVLIPGLQGRWEYLEPAVNALAKHCRVITFPLVNEPSAQARFDPAQGIDAFAACYAGDEPREGAAAFLEKRNPRFEGRAR